jgi:hypothetical protein
MLQDIILVGLGVDNLRNKKKHPCKVLLVIEF